MELQESSCPIMEDDSLILCPSTITVLEEVVKAPVFMDGGVRRGTDVFKALELGASGVFIGRSVVFSLAADGEGGVRKVLQMLMDELELTMSLTGCASIDNISQNHVVTGWGRPGPRILPSTRL